jgi:uroporphyrinogen decarboxylase
VFNLGHGISQHAPPEAVQALVDAVHDGSRRLRSGDSTDAAQSLR